MKLYRLPTSKGWFGKFGGRFAPETLMPALQEMEKAYKEARKDNKGFQRKLKWYLSHYAGRPTPLYPALSLSKQFKGAKIYLKREDLAHTGSHKINNTLGQVLLAKKMGKKRIVAETGAGQHGVATATAAALLGFPCRIYMGEEDIQRQKTTDHAASHRERPCGLPYVPRADEAGARQFQRMMVDVVWGWFSPSVWMGRGNAPTWEGRRCLP